MTDQSGSVLPKKPARERHQKLEQAKVKRETKNLTRITEPDPDAHTHGKSIAAERQGYQERFENAQLSALCE